MEKTKFAAVAPADIVWADVGAWDEVWRISSKDVAETVCEGSVITLEALGIAFAATEYDSALPGSMTSSLSLKTTS